MASKNHNKETFMEITNMDIYQKLLDVEKQVVQTNGKVKLNSLHIKGLWAAISMMIGILIWLFEHR